MLLRVSDEVEVPAVTVLPSAETMPWVTVGVPAARPRAFPIATTASPASRALELPKVTTGRFDAPLICMSATSSGGFVPINVADWLLVDPLLVMLIVP